jgi:hypothetical protein
LGEISMPRLDYFVQQVLAEHCYATAKLTRTVLSGICGWLVRQGALPANPVRDLTPLELDRDRTARALSVDELRKWLAVLDADEFAVFTHSNSDPPRTRRNAAPTLLRRRPTSHRAPHRGASLSRP